MCIQFNKTLTSRQNSMNKFSGNCDISKFLGNTNIKGTVACGHPTI